MVSGGKTSAPEKSNAIEKQDGAKATASATEIDDNLTSELTEEVVNSEVEAIVSLSVGNTTGFTKYAGVIPANSVNYSTYKAASENDTTTCEIKTYGGQEGQEMQSFWGLFVVAFISGLVALLTPCVFPMIPMTVSFFMKDGSKAIARRNGIIYGLSIVGIYVLIGTLVAVLLGPAFANLLATHWLPNVLFFLIFVVFAASFLGAFEIVLPSWIVNKADQQADKGGLTGIFFMAFTIVLV